MTTTYTTQNGHVLQNKLKQTDAIITIYTT